MRIQNALPEPGPFKYQTTWLWRVALHEYGYPMSLVVLCGSCNWICSGLNAERKIVCECGEVHSAPSDPETLNKLRVYPDTRFVTLKPCTEKTDNVHAAEPIPEDALQWRAVYVERFLKHGEQPAHA